MASKRKIPVPQESFDNYVLKDSKRIYPSMECLTSDETMELERRVRRLIHFEDAARVPYQVADYVSNWLSGKPGFEERKLLDEPEENDKKKKYFFRDYGDGDAMIIVKEGELPITKGFNLVIAHSDSPCLLIKPKPVRIEWSEDRQYYHLGVRLSATSHGGLSYHQWPAQQVRILGYAIDKDRKRINIDIPGYIPDTSAHTDYRQEQEVKDAFPPDETSEITLGHTSLEETLDTFGFESIDDFSQAKLFAVPTTTPLPMDERTWRLLCAYGHDDRVSVFSAVSAIARVRPDLTSIVWLEDNEEVGSGPPTGLGGNFIDIALDYLLIKHEKNIGEKIDERARKRLLLNSSWLYADLCPAPYGYDADSMDVDNAPKIGLGMYIEAQKSSISNLDYLRKLRNLALRGSSQGNNICYQMVGEIYHQNKQDTWFYDFTGGSCLRQMGQWIREVGIPGATLHSPNEIICPGDEYAFFQFLTRYFKHNTGIGGR
jgi:aspartyl aminopeptidase